MTVKAPLSEELKGCDFLIMQITGALSDGTPIHIHKSYPVREDAVNLNRLPVKIVSINKVMVKGF